MRWLMLAAALVPCAAVAEETRGPDVPEPMVFDLVRPLTARRGELEANVLALSPLSGQERALEWAPEVEYAVADGTAIEVELPFEGGRLAELKLGLQRSFGTLDGGRSVHGVQYLGVYERQTDRTSHALLYLHGRRWSSRWTTMSMVGVGDVRVGQSERTAGLLVNHSTFYDLNGASIAGLEVNYNSAPDGGVLLMPQFHRRIATRLSAQAGAGVDKKRGATARPVAGLRVIREF